MSSKATDTIIFDLGAVLIDWNPRHLYRKIFNDEQRMEWFLTNICTSEWNEEQDAGRPFGEATALLIRQHPEWEKEILAFWHRWEEMLGGAIEGSVDIFKQLRDSRRHKLLALTNWSAETFPIAQQKYDFLGWFEGVVMSGEEKTRKPYPEFYRILLDRYQVHPEGALFIDDNIRNINAARELGITGIHFRDPEQLRKDLLSAGVL